MATEPETDRWEPIKTAGRWVVHAKTHVTVLIIVIVCELIGTITYPLGPGQIILLPMLFAVAIAILLTYNVLGQYIGPLREFVSKEVSRIGTPLLVISLMPLAVKYGTIVGPNFNELLKAGLAFFLQEAGNLLGAIPLGLTAALLLGLKRESIGAAVSICREPTLGIITDKYGIDSPEGRGTLGTYLTGTVFGTIFFGLFAGFAPAFGFHPLSLAMACGMGSASMMTACAASLAEATTIVPDDKILAYAATSNLLTGLWGLYIVLFVNLPIINKLYEILEPKIGRG